MGGLWEASFGVLEAWGRLESIVALYWGILGTPRGALGPPFLGASDESLSCFGSLWTRSPSRRPTQSTLGAPRGAHGAWETCAADPLLKFFRNSSIGGGQTSYPDTSICESAIVGSREGVAAVISCGFRSVGFGPRPFSLKGGFLKGGLSTAESSLRAG